MKPGLTLDEMIEKLNKGETVKEEVIRITIPEGYTVDQIASKLSEQTPWDKDVFLKLADTPVGLSEDTAASGIPDNKNLKHR